jgi:hypothetical protein
VQHYYTISELYELSRTNDGKKILCDRFPEVAQLSMFSGEIVDAISEWQIRNIHLYKG